MPDVQIHFFTGENAYALRTERQRWEKQFVTKYGEENLSRLDGSRLKVAELLDEVAAAPFIAEKRLVVLMGLPGFTKEQVQALPHTVHPDVILLMIEPKLDKRKSESKALLEIATVKEFTVLEEAEVIGWLEHEAKARSITLAPGVSHLLLERLGPDQDALSSEIDKLKLLSDGQPVGFTQVEALTVASAEQEVWTLTNLVAAGKSREALAFTRSMIERGEDAYGLWSILLWSLKNLGGVWAAAKDGIKNPAQLAKETGVPFPSARSLVTAAERMKREDIQRLVTWAAEADVDLKTGALRATQEAPEEVQSLIDLLVLRMSGGTVAR